jgi:hypothetical protein
LVTYTALKTSPINAAAEHHLLPESRLDPDQNQRARQKTEVARRPGKPRQIQGRPARNLAKPVDDKEREMSPKFQWGTPFHYDPMPTLRADMTPQLWILGGEDYEAPSAETSRLVKSPIAEGLPFTLAVYPRAEHGMTLFETAAGSRERLSTRYAPGYFGMIRDFARYGELRGAYGDAEIR